MTDDQATLLDPRWDPHQTELGDHGHGHDHGHDTDSEADE